MDNRAFKVQGVNILLVQHVRADTFSSRRVRASSYFPGSPGLHPTLHTSISGTLDEKITNHSGRNPERLCLITQSTTPYVVEHIQMYILVLVSHDSYHQSMATQNLRIDE
jgi:hypothetical protein